MADVFVLPWANASCPAHLPDPYPSFAGPRLIYAGGCEGWRPDHRRDVLNELASRTRGNYQVWFCGAVAYQGHTGPTEEERARDFHAAVRFVTDALPLAERVVDRTRDPPHILQGLVPYGPHWPWLQHATAGLGPAPWPGDEWPRCKIHDYLGCGVPVIVEYDRGPPNAGDILTLQAGEVVPFGDIDAIIDAMWRIWERKPDHEVIRAKAQIYTSWDENARLLESHIEDRLAQVPT